MPYYIAETNCARVFWNYGDDPRSEALELIEEEAGECMEMREITREEALVLSHGRVGKTCTVQCTVSIDITVPVEVDRHEYQVSDSVFDDVLRPEAEAKVAAMLSGVEYEVTDVNDVGSEGCDE